MRAVLNICLGPIRPLLTHFSGLQPSRLPAWSRQKSRCSATTRKKPPCSWRAAGPGRQSTGRTGRAQGEDWEVPGDHVRAAHPGEASGYGLIEPVQASARASSLPCPTLPRALASHRASSCQVRRSRAPVGCSRTSQGGRPRSLSWRWACLCRERAGARIAGRVVRVGLQARRSVPASPLFSLAPAAVRRLILGLPGLACAHSHTPCPARRVPWAYAGASQRPCKCLPCCRMAAG